MYAPLNCHLFRVFPVIYLVTCFNNQVSFVHSKFGKGRGNSNENYYYPIDTGFVPELNHMRCVDYKGHVSGKYRWPYSCLLPASHLATGRLYDGTSSVPERILSPPWLNLTLFKEGQRFARANSGHLLLSHIYGLFCTNLFLDSKEILLFVGGFDTPEGSADRNTRIANGIFNWYRNAPPAKDFPTFKQVAKAIRNVRMAHRNVSIMADARIREQRQPDLINPARYKSRSINEGLWNAFKLDLSMSPIPFENRRFPIEHALTDDYRKPLNQFIQAITQFGFVGFPILFPERVGLTNATNQELFAFNHLWAVLAYCVGIRDEYNISLQPDLYTARKYFQDVFETFIEPAFFQVDFFTKVLIDPLLEGVNLLEMTMTPGIILTRILRDILRIPVPNIVQHLRSIEKLSLAVTDPVVVSNQNANRVLLALISENILNTGALGIENSPAVNVTKSS